MSKKQMDQLSIDATNAIKAGMSYGKYMAMKKPTIRSSAPNPDIVEYKHTCELCGKEFVTYNRKARKYCSDYCRERSYDIKERGKAKKSADKREYPIPKTCTICGKQFMAPTHREKYCSEFCVKVAHGRRMTEYMAKRAKEAMRNG